MKLRLKLRTVRWGKNLAWTESMLTKEVSSMSTLPSTIRVCSDALSCFPHEADFGWAARGIGGEQTWICVFDVVVVVVLVSRALSFCFFCLRSSVFWSVLFFARSRLHVINSISYVRKFYTYVQTYGTIVPKVCVWQDFAKHKLLANFSTLAASTLELMANLPETQVLAI